MVDEAVGRSVAFFFYAGDFVDVLRRFASGEQQIYATHQEVARLIGDLRSAGVAVTIYSFVNETAKVETPADGVRIVSLGGNGNDRGLLRRAVEDFAGDTIVAHFAYPELLKAAIKSGKRIFAVLANSYNDPGIKQFLRRKRIAAILNNERIAMVSNHCVPATRHLADIGVKIGKLVPWDIPHKFAPADYVPKQLADKPEFLIAYAGSIAEAKGVGDLVRALAILEGKGIAVKATLAGLGDIDGMKSLARNLNVADKLVFRGIIGNDEVFEMFREADMVAVPSRSSYPEGFPLTMFEAVASRSPIVCSDHPMFRPILRDGEHCAMFASGDVDGLVAAIERVVSSPELYGRLSDNADSTWVRLKGPADWRTLMTKWVVEGPASPWVQSHKLSSPARSAT